MTRKLIKIALFGGGMARVPLPLDCPFCGSEDNHVGAASWSSYHVRCLDCGARTRPFELPDRIDTQAEQSIEETLLRDAVAAWNRRSS